MVQALSRAFEIMRHIAGSESGLRLYEIADKMQLKRTTVFNLANTMIKEGMLEKRSDTRYVIGEGVRELYLSSERRNSEVKFEQNLVDLQSKYPEASLVYSELSSSDIKGKLHIPDGIESVVQYPDSMELDPYLTVCGLVFFAFAPEDLMHRIILKHPFEYKGVGIWKSKDKFLSAVDAVKKNKFAESPATPEDSLKFGVPVWNKRNCLVGVITFCFNKNKEKWNKLRDVILDDLFEVADKIKSGKL